MFFLLSLLLLDPEALLHWRSAKSSMSYKQAKRFHLVAYIISKNSECFGGRGGGGRGGGDRGDGCLCTEYWLRT